MSGEDPTGEGSYDPEFLLPAMELARGAKLRTSPTAQFRPYTYLDLATKLKLRPERKKHPNLRNLAQPTSGSRPVRIGVKLK